MEPEYPIFLKSGNMVCMIDEKTIHIVNAGVSGPTINYSYREYENETGPPWGWGWEPATREDYTSMLKELIQYNMKLISHFKKIK